MANSAATRSVSSSGLVMIMTTVSALTGVPGFTRIRCTVESVVAVMSMVSSGTKVPRPRTSRSMGPRLTVSGHRVESSTPGAAGLRLRAQRQAPARATRARVITMTVTIVLRFRTPLRCMSIGLISGLYRGTAPANRHQA